MIYLICDYMKKVLIFSIIFLAIDIISKILIKQFLIINQSITVIPNFFNLTYVLNDGAAFSILKGKQIFLILLAILLLCLVIYYLRKDKLNFYKILYYSMLIGGILGNLLDRIILGGVVDFLDFNIFGYAAPIFNLADSFIVISVILIILETFRKDNYGNKSRRR